MKTSYLLAIEGAYGENNFGDDALLKVIYEFVRKYFSEDELLVICKGLSDSSNLNDFCGESKVLKNTELEGIEFKNKVYGGGTQFFSFTKSSSFFFKFKLLLKQPDLFINLLKRKKSKLPVTFQEHYVGIGLGPFEDVNKLMPLSKVLPKAKSLFLRDTISVDYAKQVGAEQVELYTDICFYECYDFANQKKDSRAKKIAVILRDWIHSDNNFRVEDFISQSWFANYEIDFIVFGNDKQLINDLNKRGLDYVRYESNSESFNSILKAISSYDLIITSRFHGLIYSIILGVPSIALAIEPKLEIAANELSCYGCVDYDNIFSLNQMISELNPQEEQVKLIDIAKKKQQLAREMLDKLASNLS